jgi:hypothetical protein
MKGLYLVFYIVMLIGYAGVSFQASDIKGKILGVILLIANGLIFYK